MSPKKTIEAAAAQLHLEVSRYEENALGSSAPAFFFLCPLSGKEEVFMFSRHKPLTLQEALAELREWCTVPTIN